VFAPAFPHPRSPFSPPPPLSGIFPPCLFRVLDRSHLPALPCFTSFLRMLKRPVSPASMRQRLSLVFFQAFPLQNPVRRHFKPVLAVLCLSNISFSSFSFFYSRFFHARLVGFSSGQRFHLFFFSVFLLCVGVSLFFLEPRIPLCPTRPSPVSLSVFAEGCNWC